MDADAVNPSTPTVGVLREAILAADARIDENVKWNSPNFTFEGVDRLTLRVNPKGGVQLILHRGAKKDDSPLSVDDPTGSLEWRGHDRAILSVTDTEEALRLAPLVTELVQRWLAA